MGIKTKPKPLKNDKHGDPCPTLDLWFTHLEEDFLDCQVEHGGCDRCWLKGPCSLLWAAISQVSSQRELTVQDYKTYRWRFMALKSREGKD